MKNRFLIILLVSVILFCFGCQENSSEPNNINPENRIKITGQIVTSDQNYIIDSVKVILVGENTYTDTTNNQGLFEFLIGEQGTFHLIINSDDFNHLDSVFVIKSDTSITVNLQPILYDYFPLKIGNRWTYTYKLREICGGDNVYIDGTEDWEILDFLETANDSIIYKCKRNLKGIKIDARGPEPDTSTVSISDEFVIVEDDEHNIHINHASFKSDVLLQRYYTKDFPEEILYESNDGFVFIYRYEKQIGLTFWQQTTGSGHCNTTASWSLIDSFIP